MHLMNGVGGDVDDGGDVAPDDDYGCDATPDE